MITFICEKNYIAFETPIFLLFNAFKIISRENPGYNILASHKRRIRMTRQKLRPRVKAGGHYKDPSLLTVQRPYVPSIVLITDNSIVFI